MAAEDALAAVIDGLREADESLVIPLTPGMNDRSKAHALVQALVVRTDSRLTADLDVRLPNGSLEMLLDVLDGRFIPKSPPAPAHPARPERAIHMALGNLLNLTEELRETLGGRGDPHELRVEALSAVIAAKTPGYWNPSPILPVAARPVCSRWRKHGRVSPRRRPPRRRRPRASQRGDPDLADPDPSPVAEGDVGQDVRGLPATCVQCAGDRVVPLAIPLKYQGIVSTQSAPCNACDDGLRLHLRLRELGEPSWIGYRPADVLTGEGARP